MLTYQDLIQVPERDADRMSFVLRVINEHKSSDMYKTAKIADDYFKKQNTTIMRYEKMLTTLSGQKVPDKWSANHKVVSGFFKRFVTQQVQFLLGNGVTWENNTDIFGDKFDIRLQSLAKAALTGGVSFGFWDLDQLRVFKVTEFAPLWDENTSALRAGVRWWQIAPNKPLRATLYEEDGFTEYAWNRRDADTNSLEGEVIQEKRGYVTNNVSSDIDGTQIVDYTNYPGFPIVPLWGNPEHQSEIVGIREGIDEYDFIKNGYANDLDNAQVYWIIKGAGGMDDPDLARFLERLKLTHAAAPGDGQEVSAQTIQIPYEARQQLLARVERDLYRDYMALNTEDLSSRNATATEIKAAYEPMSAKADDFEYQVLDFLDGIMAIAGVDDTASFTRSYIINTQEEVSTVIGASQFTGAEYTTEKVLTLLGDGDKTEEILKQQAADELSMGGLESEAETAEEPAQEDIEQEAI